MKILLKIEELAMLALGLYLFSQLSYPWWMFAVFFLAPDIGMAGYLVNSKTGAITYNFLHLKSLGIALYLAGVYMQIPVLMFAGIIVFSHSSFDRLLGYGLKYSDSFKNTHLGPIGKMTQ